MKKTTTGSARITALNMLESVLDSGRNLGENDTEVTTGDPRDLAFARHLAYGVLRWQVALQWFTNQLLKKPLRQKDQDINRLILIGLFQLWKGDAAAHAAIHESAECARKVGKPWAVSVINAVLRRFQREQSDFVSRLDDRDEKFAHPQWLLEALREDWPQDWQNIAEANNQAAPLWVRLNRNFDEENTVKGLLEGGFSVEQHSSAPEALKISPASSVASLPGFDEGRFSVQDPAAQLAVGLLKLAPGHHVLDACAAPGGKTCHILESEPDVKLIALDRKASRLAHIRENLDRLGFGDSEQVSLLAADAANTDDWWDGTPFDRILLDAPCTATGVIRRHPEIKWLRSPDQVTEVVAVQGRLLAQLWPLLKTGGILLYATCSVLQAENSRQIQQFVDHHTDAELLETDATWGQKLDSGRQILPGEAEMDGFFYASLHKAP